MSDMEVIIIKILEFIGEFVIGIFSKRLKNWISLRKVIRSAEEKLKQLLTNQIEKQKKTAKYIPDIFVENHDAKETCRFFAVPENFWEKVLWDINKLNFNHLNRQLNRIGIKSFEVAVPKQLLMPPNADRAQTGEV